MNWSLDDRLQSYAGCKHSMCQWGGQFGLASVFWGLGLTSLRHGRPGTTAQRHWKALSAEECGPVLSRKLPADMQALCMHRDRVVLTAGHNVRDHWPHSRPPAGAAPARVPHFIPLACNAAVA
jgi:hypothetical protein